VFQKRLIHLYVGEKSKGSCEEGTGKFKDSSVETQCTLSADCDLCLLLLVLTVSLTL